MMTCIAKQLRTGHASIAYSTHHIGVTGSAIKVTG